MAVLLYNPDLNKHQHKNMKVLKIIVLICLISATGLVHAEKKLVFSLDLVRHGDRTPTCDLPKYPLKLKQGSGGLTVKGIQQELALGKELRNIYVNQTHLLPDKYAPETMYIRSTDTKRTIESANSILSGLYPQTKIPVHTVPISEDTLLIANPGYNPFKLIERYIRNRHEWNKITNEYKTQLDHWGSTAGIELSNPDNLNCLADNLHYRKRHYLPMPRGISQQDANEIISIDDTMTLNEFNHYSFPMGNEFLKSANKYIADAVERKSKLKYALFVGHDATLMSVMHALNIPIKHIPDYASRLNFSVYEKNQSYVTVISLNGKPL